MKFEDAANVDPKMSLANELNKDVTGDSVTRPIAPFKDIIVVPHRADADMFLWVGIEDIRDDIVREQSGIVEAMIGKEDSLFESLKIVIGF